jgi:hypothetical protein
MGEILVKYIKNLLIILQGSILKDGMAQETWSQR